MGSPRLLGVLLTVSVRSSLYRLDGLFSPYCKNCDFDFFFFGSNSFSLFPIIIIHMLVKFFFLYIANFMLAFFLGRDKRVFN